jgi:hypothetical protein
VTTFTALQPLQQAKGVLAAVHDSISKVIRAVMPATQDLASCNEGELTAAKSKLVSNQQLARCAQQAGLHHYVRLMGYSPRTCTPAGMAGRGVHMVGAPVQRSQLGLRMTFTSFHLVMYQAAAASTSGHHSAGRTICGVWCA